MEEEESKRESRVLVVVVVVTVCVVYVMLLCIGVYVMGIGRCDANLCVFGVWLDLGL